MPGRVANASHRSGITDAVVLARNRGTFNLVALLHDSKQTVPSMRLSQVLIQRNAQRVNGLSLL